MNYVLTGNKGFIASHLERYLLACDSTHSVFGVDKINSYDLMEKQNVDKLPACDVLLHLAASNGTRYFYEKPTEIILNNTIPTLNLIERYKSSNTKFVFASTCELFNGATDLGIYSIPTDEKVPVVFQDVLNPRWSYSLPKALGENAVANSMKNWLIVRYFNIYGPNQRDHFIDEFVSRVKRGHFFINGDDTRSFCYVDDAVKLTDIALKKFSNQIVNIGCQQEYRISYIAKLIMKEMGINPERLEIRGGPQGSVRRRCPDMSKLLNESNYSYEYSLEDGIIKTLESYR